MPARNAFREVSFVDYERGRARISRSLDIGDSEFVLGLERCETFVSSDFEDNSDLERIS